MRFQYKKEYSFEQRKSEGSMIRKKYPDRVPVILEKNSQSRNGSQLRRKYLVPGDITVAQFHHLIWQSQSDSHQGLWFFVNNVIPPASVTMSWLYEEYHDDDFFLYIGYSEENVFGR